MQEKATATYHFGEMGLDPQIKALPLPVLLWTLNRKDVWGLADYNQAARGVAGLHGSLIGLSPEQALPGSRGFTQGANACLAQGKAVREVLWRPPDRDDGHGRFTGYFARLKSRSVIVALTPLPEESRSNAEARVPDNSLRMAFEKTTDAVVFVDDLGRHLEVNPAACELIGFTREEYLTMSVPDVSGLDAEASRVSWAQFLETEKMKGRFPLKGKNGDLIWVDLNAVANVVDGVHLAIFRDITELATTEQALRDSEERLRTLLANFPDVISRFDRNFRHTYVSPSISRYSAIPMDRFIGKTNAELGYSGELVDLWDRELAKVFASGQRCDLEFEIPIGRGKAYFESLLVPEMDGQGRVGSVLVVARDISRLKKAEERARRKSQELYETNIALKVLLDQQNDQKELQWQQITTNINSLILPYLDQMEKGVDESRQASIISLVKRNLRQLHSQFSRSLILMTRGLTIKEIQVADMVKGGLGNKEIARHLGVSPKTVEYYRDSIRDKLGIKNSGINLKSYLISNY